MSVWNERRSRQKSVRAIIRPLAVFCCLGFVLWVLCLPPSAANLLPSPQIHPLPATLVERGDRSQGDYFDQIQKTQSEYLVWSQFPIKVYVEPATDGVDRVRANAWVKAVQSAIREWNALLPLQEVTERDQADIQVLRSSPPLRISQTSRMILLPRIRSAETKYELYTKQISNSQAVLAQRCTVVVRPNQAIEYVLASARHELGHALGIWGHSPRQTDALYFSQVRNPPLISPRDVNTLKRIYEQPTRSGWPIP